MASALGAGSVCLPAGNYKTSATINATGVLITGAGWKTTILPSNNGDTFYFGGSAPYAFGGGLENMHIARSDNPAAGDGVHFVYANNVHVSHVQVDGEFGAYEVQSSLHITFDGANSIGNNSTTGSFGYRFHKAVDGAPAPSEIFVANSNVRGQSGPSISYALIINASDGIVFTNNHFGWGNQAGVLITPENEDDDIYGILMDNQATDNSAWGVLITCGASYTGSMQLLRLTGVVETSANDGLTASCPALTGFDGTGLKVSGNKGNGINLSAGQGFHLTGAIFTSNNFGNLNGSDVVLSGTVSDVSLDGASYYRSMNHAPLYNIVVSGSATSISAVQQHFSGASIAATNNTSTGTVQIISVGSTAAKSSMPL
jgi:hypothetical protein